MERVKNNVLKTIGLLVVAGLFGGLVSAWVVSKMNKNTESQTINLVAPPQMPITKAAFSPSGEPLNFSDAAEHSVSSVVHVKVAYETQKYMRGGGDIFEHFFGNPGNQPQMQEYTPRSSGSGVIISADGYIVTNNHVIDNANEITVTFNDKTTLTAQVVGKDPTTDIALIKVDVEELPALGFANSDDLRLGEWVLAVGNPFNLTSTVTAGIVSAKARQLNIIPSEFSIESFIQTDAAVNPGNSGGALVNLKGELVGINTAIASRSGQYEGYAFAVPANIVKKVVEDLIQHGVVQRAFLGISYIDLNEDIPNIEEIAKEEGIKDVKELQKHKGVYVAQVFENSSAKEAGIQKGDIITRIAGKDVTSKSTIVEEVGKLRPGDKIEITAIRDGKTKQFSATLRNKAGNTDLVTSGKFEVLGATFENVDKGLASKLKIEGGAQVASISNGKLKENNIKTGFIITKVNQHVVNSVDDLKEILSGLKKGGVFIEGIYPNGKAEYIAFGI